VGREAIDGVTSTEVLQEILHVRAPGRGPGDAVAAVRSATALVSEVLPVTKDDVGRACERLEASPGLGLATLSTWR
jgi:hypothetical protein